MKKTPIEWRQQHPRCAFCHWLKYDKIPDILGLGFNGWYECSVKEKTIHHISLPRPFCKCYKTREVKELNV